MTTITKMDVRNEAYSPRTTKTKVFFHQSGESVLENFQKRVTGETPTSRDLREMMPEVLRKLGLPEDTLFRFNRYCGCSSCPCSPGFDVDQVGAAPQTVFVDYV